MRLLHVICIMGFLTAHITGCLKAPDNSVTPSMKLDYRDDNGTVVYTLTVTTGVRNDNPQHALTAVKGNISVIDSAGSIVKHPFSLDKALPFVTSPVEVSFTVEPGQAERLLKVMKKTVDELKQQGTVSSMFMEEGAVVMEGIIYDSVSIISLIQQGKGSDAK